MTTALIDRLAVFQAGSGIVTAADAVPLWNVLTDGDPRLASEASEFALVVHEQLMDDVAVEFGLGSWELDLRTAIAQSVLCGGAVAVLLTAVGATDLPAAVVAAVVPVLFNVHAVQLDRDDDVLLLHLQRSTGDDGIVRTVDDLYRGLDRRTRKQLSKEQFAQFLDSLVEAGAADRASLGRYRIRGAGQPAFLRVTIR